ncbi:MAG: HlyC/CorC family transporter [Thioalkalivibrionaceae bacterium]
MQDIPLSTLFIALGGLFVLSAFFSGSETALMALNRYRMRHRATRGHRGARLASNLLERPDRLIGLILLGNNLVNILITQIATFIGLRLFGNPGIAIATGVLTILLLLFAETAPKTVGALHAERIAYPAAYVYSVLIRVLLPLVVLINVTANGVLRAIGVRVTPSGQDAMSSDELRSAVAEAGHMLSGQHQKMLLNLLDLERATVDDIMIPPHEVDFLDLEDDWNDLVEQILTTHFTRLPVVRGELDRVQGFIHLRDLLPLVYREDFDREQLEQVITPPYFIPEGTSLHRQLIEFQRERRRIGLVVDEYGEIRGLVTLEDLLEEIVGEFTTDAPAVSDEIRRQADGSVVADGAVSLRELNRMLGLELPLDGPKTLNGLVVEHLEHIPEAPMCIAVSGLRLEVIQTKDNRVRSVRLLPDGNTGWPAASTRT